MVATKKDVVIDTDAGADDLLALILAYRSNVLNIRAVVTSYGSFYEHDAFSRVQAVLDYLGASDSIPVVRGSGEPIVRDFSIGPLIHGTVWTGKHKAKVFSKKVFIDEIRPFLTIDKKITYIVLGPLSNLQKLCTLIGTAYFEKAVIMGGVFEQPGNVTTDAEANFFWDPEAVHSIFSTDIPIDLVPLDVTECIQLDPDAVRNLKDSNFINRFFLPYYEYYVHTKRRYFDGKKHKDIAYHGGALHDVVTVLSVANPSVLRLRNAHICTDKATTTRRGYVYETRERQLLRDGEGVNSDIRIAKEINVERFWKTFNTILTHSGDRRSYS